MADPAHTAAMQAMLTCPEPTVHATALAAAREMSKPIRAELAELLEYADNVSGEGYRDLDARADGVRMAVECISPFVFTTEELENTDD